MLKNRVKSFLLQLVVIAAVFGLMEFGLRVYAHTIGHKVLLQSYKMPDDRYGWVLKPGYRAGDIRINSWGFRGADFSLKKDDGVYRILTLGDSITFGSSLAVSYPEYLQEMLNSNGREGKRYEVINGGVPGYATGQVFLKLKDWAPRLKPDLVILYCGWNDFFSYYPGDPRFQCRADSWFNRLLERSYVLKMLVKVSFQYVRPHVNALKRKAPELYQLYRDYEPVQTRQNIREIIRFIEENNLKAVIMTMPGLLDADDLERYRSKLVFPFFTTDEELLKILLGKYNSLITEEAGSSRSVHLFELREKFKDMHNIGRLFLDLNHFNDEGTKIFAESLCVYLRENNLL